MQFNIFSDYSSWYFILCLFVGILYASFFYFREKKIQKAIERKWLRNILAVCRVIVIALLAFLLLNPFIKTKFNEEIKPIVVIAQDNSTSASYQLDTSEYKENIEAFKNAMSKHFDVRFYTFGESLQSNGSLHFNEKITDISDALHTIQNMYQNMHVAGIVLATDGIFNQGMNPAFEKNILNSPIYTIALGDSTAKKDVLVQRILYNEIVYLKDDFNVQVDIETEFCKGENIQVSISEISPAGNVAHATKILQIQNNPFTSRVEFNLNASTSGIKHYRIAAQKIENEISYENNVQDFFVEVLDTRKKILLLADAPHPDITAVRSAITSNKNYELDFGLAENFQTDVSNYACIILHNLPSYDFPIKNILNEIQQKDIAVFFLAGSEINIAALNGAQNIFSINTNARSTVEAMAQMQSAFNLFVIDENLTQAISRFPPLISLYGKYTVSESTQVLLTQKIGNVVTQNPMLIIGTGDAKKYAVWNAENIWKWRMYDFVFYQSHEIFDSFFGKVVQYLSVNKDKKQFTAKTTKNVFTERDKILLDAELYNDSYELVNEPDASLVIKNESGKEFKFQMSKTNNRYFIDIGIFPPGNYTFAASTTYNKKVFQDAGAFTVSALNIETMQTTAQHQLLNRIAAESGGKQFMPNQFDALEKSLLESAYAKPILQEKTETQSLIQLKWIFFGILFLLSLEWFIRKYSGSY